MGRGKLAESGRGGIDPVGKLLDPPLGQAEIKVGSLRLVVEVREVLIAGGFSRFNLRTLVPLVERRNGYGTGSAVQSAAPRHFVVLAVTTVPRVLRVPRTHLQVKQVNVWSDRYEYYSHRLELFNMRESIRLAIIGIGTDESEVSRYIINLCINVSRTQARYEEQPVLISKFVQVLPVFPGTAEAEAVDAEVRVEAVEVGLFDVILMLGVDKESNVNRVQFGSSESQISALG